MQESPKIHIVKGEEYIEYSKETYSEQECLKRSEEFYQKMDKRRSVRTFSDRHIPKAIIENDIHGVFDINYLLNETIYSIRCFG